MENTWIIFDHIQRLKDWTIMSCQVYDSQYCKVLTPLRIVICNLKMVQYKLSFGKF